MICPFISKCPVLIKGVTVNRSDHKGYAGGRNFMAIPEICETSQARVDSKIYQGITGADNGKFDKLFIHLFHAVNLTYLHPQQKPTIHAGFCISNSIYLILELC